MPWRANYCFLPSDLATDSFNNLYMYAVDPYIAGGFVLKAKPKATAYVKLGILTSTSGGIRLTKNSDLVLADYYNATVNIYAPGQKTPSRTLAVTRPQFIAFDQAETHLYVSTFGAGRKFLLSRQACKLARHSTTTITGLHSTHQPRTNPGPLDLCTSKGEAKASPFSFCHIMSDNTRNQTPAVRSRMFLVSA